MATVVVLGCLDLTFPNVVLDAYSYLQKLAGTGPRGGLLFIEAPQVYTRERLVNDRFDQANWLTNQLEVSSREAAATRMQAASRVVDLRSQVDISLSRGSEPQTDAAPKPEQKQTPEDRPQIDPAVELDRAIDYRNKVRSELMDTQLDDSHDLDGNTLYRFNFDTVVMPWADVRRYPGTAVFLITAQSTRQAEDNTQPTDAQFEDQIREARDDLELLQSWQREIQNFLTKVVRFRVESFYAEGQTETKSDPKEDILFEFFLRKTLMDAYLDILSANIAAHCQMNRPKAQPCPDIWKNKSDMTDEKNRSFDDILHLRRQIISKYLQLNYSDSFNKNIIYPPKMELGFKTALLVAHTINTLHWPKLSEKSYREECKRKYSGMGASAEIERECLLPYSDRGSKRAMIRLVMVMEAMKKRMDAHGRPLFEVGPLDAFDEKSLNSTSVEPPHWFKFMSDAFAQIIPDRNNIEALAREIGHTYSDNRSIHPLEQVEARCERGQYLYDRDTFTWKHLTAYGRCRFLRSHAAKIDNLVARFIHQRIVEGQTMFGEMAVTNFVDVDKVGCDVAECRIEVRSKSREALLCLRSNPSDACGHSDIFLGEKDDKRKEFSRIMAACYNIINDRATLIHATTGVGRTTYEPYPFNGKPNYSLSDNEKMVFFDCVTAFELRNWLEESNANIAVYEISPHASGKVVYRASQTKASGGAGIYESLFAGRISGASEARAREIGLSPNVAGFGQLGPNSGGTRQKAKATFGWVVRPQESIDERWTPSHHRLSAIISVPSWWKRLQFDIKACWTTPERARKIGFGIVEDPERICDSEKGEQPSKGNGWQTSDAAKNVGLLKRTFVAQLPRRTEEVTERFRFDFIKAPFLDDQWLASNPALRLEAGRPGKLVVLGGRLWRGTVATVMGQPANKITVLPDMKGVIAEFDCVATPADIGANGRDRAGSQEHSAPSDRGGKRGPSTSPGATATDRRQATNGMLKVWTSEGRTQDTPVEIYPFNPEFGGRPCDAVPLSVIATPAEAPKPTTTQQARP